MIHVAVGLIIDTSGKVLVAKRADDAHQGGLWEFPGGKVEASETVEQALARELKEELDISVQASSPVMQISHDYGDKSVLLDVWLVDHIAGEAIGKEGQAIKWLAIEQLGAYQFPAANGAIVNWLRDTYSLSV